MAETQQPTPEYLSVPVDECDLRAEEGDQPRLVGYASKYGNWYQVYDFQERIKSGAFDDVLADDETDVVASMNHDVNFAFARQSAGTLRLSSNSVGLQYEADITDDDGRKVYDKVKSGTIKGSSFMFADVEDEWQFKDGEPPRRTITRVGRLYELGPVVWPANSSATVKARAAEILAEARQRHASPESGEPDPVPNAEQNRDEPPVEPIDAERVRSIEAGYRKAERIINRCQAAMADA